MDDEYIPQNDVADVGRNNPDLEFDLSKKIRKAGAQDRSDTKKSERSATKRAGEDETSPVQHGAQSERTTSQLRPFHNTVPLQFPDGYEKVNVVIGEFENQWIQIAPLPPWICPESIFERQEVVSSILKPAIMLDCNRAHYFSRKVMCYSCRTW